jgi:AraC-like DNA-binding protein
LNQNFFDFINFYRVQEVKTRLNDPAEKHLTFVALAQEAGFNSKSAFYAAFKKHTKMTPSQFSNQTDQKPSELN